jgi:tRNA (guanine-N7-)-methyltransferase
VKPIEGEHLVVPGRELEGPDRWETVFGRPGPITVENGFGNDEFLLDLAERRPEECFLAIDYSRPRARSYLNKIALRKLRNVRVLLEHAAAALGLCLDDGTVREYYVLFPDPWPKKRHAEHRLVAPWFAREVLRTLVPGGRIHIATDDAPYRDQVLTVMESGGFVNARGPGGHGPRPDDLESTIFERRWIERGREVYHMRFERETET